MDSEVGSLCSDIFDKALIKDRFTAWLIKRSRTQGPNLGGQRSMVNEGLQWGGGGGGGGVTPLRWFRLHCNIWTAIQ